MCSKYAKKVQKFLQTCLKKTIKITLDRLFIIYSSIILMMMKIVFNRVPCRPFLCHPPRRWPLPASCLRDSIHRSEETSPEEQFTNAKLAVQSCEL